MLKVCVVCDGKLEPLAVGGRLSEGRICEDRDVGCMGVDLTGGVGTVPNGDENGLSKKDIASSVGFAMLFGI